MMDVQFIARLNDRLDLQIETQTTSPILGRSNAIVRDYFICNYELFATKRIKFGNAIQCVLDNCGNVL